jgi:CRISPR-associated endonuclease Csn1
MAKLKYRLALDLGSTSLGWAMVRLNAQQEPQAVIKAGVRIFSDGRNPKDGSSLAVTRREARAMRRRRDRLLKRKNRMMKTLITHGFFPKDEVARKTLEKIEPLSLRCKGLDKALKPEEFGRALFHINQRRGFKSNRKTDKKENDSGALKTAISQLRHEMQKEGCRTVGEWLFGRHKKGMPIRARYRETPSLREDGKKKIDKSYDLYIDRAMIEDEFDALWAKQTELNPNLFNETARFELKDCLLHQRPLKPVKPGRCTLIPDEERAPVALPSQQRFRIYQEINHLRLLQEDLTEIPLTLAQRDKLALALESNNKRTFTQIRKIIGLSVKFNLEDEKRTELKGNATSALLSKQEHFGNRWADLEESKQDTIVMQLLTEENEAKLIAWLQTTTGIDEASAERIANASLPEGYGSLSAKALVKILFELRKQVVTYDKAVLAAGFESHSRLQAFGEVPGRTFDTEIERIDPQTGEVQHLHAFNELPYYGEYLQRHVGFGSGDPKDPPEKRFGKIANPTVHIGLNQVRTVVNALIKKYGHPSEVIVEVARELKQNQEQRKEEIAKQVANQRRNERLRTEIALKNGIDKEQVSRADIQKMILWEELSFNAADRRCPYSGVQIGVDMLLSDQVEIDHILPFSQTLDDSLNNKTVAIRQANRIKGNRTPWQAKDDFAAQGWPIAELLARAELMPKNKRYRFGENGYSKWLREDKNFLARALNDTRHLSRVAKAYLSLICPQNTRVIPGQMTAMLRAKFGLNNILGVNGEKNRNDHRHHAVDACVIAVTDQAMLQRFSNASASTREHQLNKLVDTMPLPWPTYREHVQRAIERIWVSHKPDHGHEGGMHNDTAYGLLDNGCVYIHKNIEGRRTREEFALKVIHVTNINPRHGLTPNGDPKPYKGYKGDSNYCIEIFRNTTGRWEGEVISTYEAYQIVRRSGVQRLRHPHLSCSGKPLIMRLVIDDIVKFNLSDGVEFVGRVATISGNGQIFMAALNEANVDMRNRDKTDSFAYVSKMPRSLQKAQGRRISVSPIGVLKDLGFTH